MTRKPRKRGGGKTTERARPPERSGSADATRRRPLDRRLEIGVAAALVVLVVALHAIFLERAGGLWRDEANSAAFAFMPTLTDAARNLRYDSFPLGGTIALRAWTAVAPSDFGLRVFGLLVGLALVAALFASGRMLGARIPLLSLGLLAVNPVVLRYGDSIRPYGLGALFVVTTAGLVAKLATTGSTRALFLAAASAILCVQCLYQNSFLVLAICLGGAAVCRRRKDGRGVARVLAVGVAAAISLLPYVGKIRAAAEWSVVAEAPMDFGETREVIESALNASGRAFPYVWLGLLVGGVVLAGIELRKRGVPAAGTGRSREGAGRVARSGADGAGSGEAEGDLLLFSVVTLVAGILVFLSFVLALTLTTRVWYYVGLMALVALCLDGVFGIAAKERRRAIVRLLVPPVLALLALRGALREIELRATSIDWIASRLQATATKDDLVVVNPWYLGIAFHHAYHGPAPWVAVPPLRDLSIHRYDLLKEAMASEDPLRPVFDRVRDTLASGKRVFFVGGFSYPRDGEAPPSLPPAPAPPVGWNNGPFLDAWTLELGDFIRRHATAGRDVPLEERQPVHPIENPPLLVFEGFRP